MKIVKKRGGFKIFGRSKEVKITTPEQEKTKPGGTPDPQKQKPVIPSSPVSQTPPKTSTKPSNQTQPKKQDYSITGQSKLSSKIKKDLQGAQTLKEKKIYVEYALQQITAKKSYYNAKGKHNKSQQKEKEKTQLESFQKTLEAKLKEQENINREKIPNPTNNTNKPKPDDFLTNYGKLTRNYETQLIKHNKLKSQNIKTKLTSIDKAEFEKQKKLLILKHNMPIPINATCPVIKEIAERVKAEQIREEARKKANPQGLPGYPPVYTTGYTPGYTPGYPPGYPPGYYSY